MFAKDRKDISSIHDLFGLFDGVVYTKYGSVLGGIKLYGRDSDGMLEQDHVGLSLIGQKIYERLPKHVIITQLYVHYEGVKVTCKERDDSISKLITSSRTEHLNSKNLSESVIYHFFEIMPSERLNKANFWQLLKHACEAPFNKSSREVIKAQFSHEETIIMQLEELNRQKNELERIINDVVDSWNGVVKSEPLSAKDVWAASRFLANANPTYIKSAKSEEVKDSDWDKTLSDGDIDPVQVKGVEMLKLNSVEPSYVRIATVGSFGKSVLPGIWSFDDESPMWIKGNSAILTRWKPLTEFQKSLLFKKKENDLERSSISFFDMITGNDKKTAMEKKALMKPIVAEKFEQLAAAEGIQSGFGLFHSAIMVFDKDPAKVIESSRYINKSASRSNLSLIWENAHLDKMFACMQIAGGKKSIRDTLFTTAQMAAASLITKRVTGTEHEPDIPNEEANLVVQCVDNTIFYFNQTAGEKALIIGTGPSGTGKTFFKNLISVNFAKYPNSLYRAIDIDDGSETIAELFGDEGGVFTINEEKMQGFNPFSVAKGENNIKFIEHQRAQMIRMLEMNDEAIMQKLERGEQKYIDQAIQKVLDPSFPKELRRFGSIVKHLPVQTAEKFARWVYASNEREFSGIYAPLFDSEMDSVGNLDKRVAVFNLNGLKGMPKVYAMAVNEIFYRLISVFENPAYETIAKSLDIDEAHHFLRDPKNVDFVCTSSVTWRKYLSRLSLWSQSPRHYRGIPNWEALRTSASTFIFMADPLMNVDEYMQTYAITKGECEAIRSLIPKREAYIIQPHIGVSKKIRIDVEPNQYVIATSRPSEKALRKKNINKYGLSKGIEKTAEELCELDISEIDVRSKRISSMRKQYYGVANV